MAGRVPFLRQHTGTFTGDQMQRTAQRAVQKANDLDESLTAAIAMAGQGYLRIMLPDADYTLTASEAGAAFLYFAGTLTAARRVYIPRAASDAQAFARWVYNGTTGGFAVTLRNDDGSLSVTNGAASFMVVSKTNGVEAWV